MVERAAETQPVRKGVRVEVGDFWFGGLLMITERWVELHRIYLAFCCFFFRLFGSFYFCLFGCFFFWYLVWLNFRLKEQVFNALSLDSCYLLYPSWWT